MNSQPTSFKEILNRWPGTKQFAAAVGVPYWRARQWLTRDSVPPAYWELLRVAYKRDFNETLDYSAFVRAVPRHRRRDAA